MRFSCDGGGGFAILEVYREGGATVCGIYKLEATVDLKPKAWLRTIRAEIRKLEALAGRAGCDEFRVSGRDWSRVLTDYQRMDGDAPNLLVKRLHHG